MRRKSIILFRAALTDFIRNNCDQMAAGIAFWAVFSLFPLALIAVSILGSIYASPEGQQQLAEGLVKLAPVSADYLSRVMEEIVHARGALGSLAFVGLLVSGTAMFSAVRKGINHAWHIRLPRFILVELATDLAMLLAAMVILIVEAIVASNVLGVLSPLPLLVRGSLVGGVALEIAAVFATFGVLLLVHRFVPNTKVAWSDVWLGALMSAILFQGLYASLTWFFADFFTSNFNLVYGPLSALMAAMIWAYLSAMALLWGAEISYTYSHLWGSHVADGLIEDLEPATVRGGRGGFRGLVETVAGWFSPPKRTHL